MDLSKQLKTNFKLHINDCHAHKLNSMVSNRNIPLITEGLFFENQYSNSNVFQELTINGDINFNHFYCRNLIYYDDHLPHLLLIIIY